MFVRLAQVIVCCVAVLWMSAPLAHAQTTASMCGTDVQITSGSVVGDFDPFNPSGQNFPAVTLTFERNVGGGGRKTSAMAFYMFQQSGSTGNQVIYEGSNILYWAGGPAPPPFTINGQNVPSNQPAGIGYIDWPGLNQDIATRTVNITLGSGFDYVAQPTIVFDLVYVCKATGNPNFTDVLTPTTRTGVITIAIRVLSGLQVSYAGPALDFGDISTLTAGGPFVDGLFHIRSSGAYGVTLTSANGFLMSYPSGPITPGTATVEYQIDFIGNVLTNTAQGFSVSPHCRRAGVDAIQYIPIRATLLEGGVGHTPSPTYSDTLTVTFSPIDDPGTTGVFCSSP